MKNTFKILLILGVSLLIIGGIIFTISMFVNGWDFSVLSNVYYEKKTYENTCEGIDNIVVEANTEDVEFVLVDSDKITVEYNNAKSKKGTIISEFIPKIDGNTLSLKEFNKKFVLTFNALSNEHKITVKLPKSKVFSIKAETSTGKVLIGEQGKETTYSKIDVETNTGDFKVLGKINCLDNFLVELDTGSITANGEIVCENNLNFEVDTGKININSNLTAKDAKLKSDTGKITLNGEVTAKSISFEVDTGDVLCKNAILGEDINVSTATGDITLILKGAKSEYSYLYEISTGKSNMPSFIGGSRTIKVKSATGDVNVSFKE